MAKVKRPRYDKTMIRVRQERAIELTAFLWGKDVLDYPAEATELGHLAFALACDASALLGEVDALGELRARG